MRNVHIAAIIILIHICLFGCQKQTVNRPPLDTATQISIVSNTSNKISTQEKTDQNIVKFYKYPSGEYNGYRNIATKQVFDANGNEIHQGEAGKSQNNNESNKVFINISNHTTFTDVFNKTFKNFKPKTDFETTEDYKGRCADFASKEFTILLDPTLNARKAYFKYDADKKEGSIKLPTSSRKNFFAIEVSDIEKNIADKGSYIASNAFGVAKKVTVRELKYDILSVHNTSKDFEFIVNCDTDTALSISKHYNVAITFVLNCQDKSNTLALKEAEYSGPTLSAPVDGVFKYRRLNVILKNIVIYNDKSKEIIAKRSF